MALKAIISDDAFSALKDDVKKLYVEAENGGYILDVEETNGWALDNVSGLKSALGKERSNVERVKEELKALKRSYDDIDVEDYKKKISRLEELEKLKPEEQAAKLIAEEKRLLAEKHSKEVAALQSQIDNLNKSIEDKEVNEILVKAITEKKGSLKLLLPHVRSQVRSKRTDGKIHLEVVDADGTIRYSNKQGSSDLMTPSELVEEMTKNQEFAACFAGSGASGSGTTGRNGAGNSNSVGTVSSRDFDAFGRNLENIAKGKVQVVSE